MELSILVPMFAAAAAVVWWAGTRLPAYAAAIARRTGIGQAFAGMLLLGGITSLPELSTAVSAAAIGASSLALNNILGSVAFNILLIAMADAVLGNRPLTSVVAQPATLIQGVLGMLLLAFVAAAVLWQDVGLAGVGIWSLLVFAGCLIAMRIAYRYERRPRWVVIDPGEAETHALEAETQDEPERLYWGMAGLALLILGAGSVLAMTGDEIAVRTGLGSGLVGLIFVALATSLPELSSISSAIRTRHYELAIGEVFGSNIFNLALILVIDLVAPGPPVLGMAGRFEAIAALLGLALTGIYVIGLIERRNRTFLRMGYDSLTAILLYVAAMAFLFTAPS
ncbi:cation:H+ antiporter [Altererythrobacter atlanticus]|uniref:Inner membrane protein YrbG n=1 Tax=Croceibacterium atlanticum TaxID=1267766 RepID=A0A0F7KTP2_9SPHN|nr:sodium:calcium antiporter [Croceibacterium atlanticum]AKH43778.1 Inner membrane protein YrbG [Croceibacterium atlanticum]MBB5733773.1 cation:H+ antiporter [Croceibacterium atlanticum]